MILDTQQADERAQAIRTLLAHPMTTRERDPEAFRLVAVHRAALADWFDTTCGWTLHVDLGGGTARLVKRRAEVAPPRPATRPSDRQAFDQTRYILLMAVSGELVARPHTTISELADALAHACAADEVLPTFDAANLAHRRAFADVLLWLIDHGYATITAGALEQYASQGRDAVLEADVPRLATIPASVRPPSRIDADGTDSWLAALRTEPRYGSDDASDEQRNLHARHTIARAVLDDPALDVDTLDERVVRWLSSPAGGRVTARAVASAGLRLERHTDVLVAVDETRTATDTTFAERSSTRTQAAAVLLAALLHENRRPKVRSRKELEQLTAGLLDADEGWAKEYQKPAGAQRLAADALDELVAFGLVRLEGDTVHPRPAASRFAIEITDCRRSSAAAALSETTSGSASSGGPGTRLPFDEDLR